MTQDSENWSILQELFHLAEETAPEDRERVLTERCGDAAIVRRPLEIFQCSTVLREGAPAKAPLAELGRVGQYTLIRLLGSGGIGTVYLAERILGGAPQRVALKMLAPHAAGPSFVERFRREQHIALSAHALQLAGTSGIAPPAAVWIRTFYTQDRYELGYDNERDVTIQQAAIQETLDRRVPDNERAYATLVLALLLARNGSLQEQQVLIERAINIYKSEPYAACDLAIATRLLANLRDQMGDLNGSVAMYRSSWDGIRQCKGDNSNEAMLAAGYLGEELAGDGQPQQAISLLEDTLPKLEQVEGTDNRFLAPSIVGLSRSYVAVGRYQDAERLAAQLSHLVSGDNVTSASMGNCQLVWAQALAGEGRSGEALVHARLAGAAYTGERSKVPSIVANAGKAHQLMLDMQARVNQEPPR